MNKTKEVELEKISRVSKTGLRPCPFCGSISLSLITYEENCPLTIECNDCGTTGPVGKNKEIEQDCEKRIEFLRMLWDIRRDSL
jgi:hypothetical protein